MEYISVGRRAVALILDALVFLVVSIPVAAMTHGIRNETVQGPYGPVHSASFRLTGVPFLLTLLAWLAYMTVAEAKTGRTLGKAATGIQVTKEDGSPIDFTAALARNLLRVIDGLFFYLVGALLIWNSPKRQRLGDRAAHTVVVPKTASSQATTTMWAEPTRAPVFPPPPSVAD